MSDNKTLPKIKKIEFGDLEKLTREGKGLRQIGPPRFLSEFDIEEIESAFNEDFQKYSKEDIIDIINSNPNIPRNSEGILPKYYIGGIGHDVFDDPELVMIYPVVFYE